MATPATTVTRVRRALPRLTRSAVARMQVLPWFPGLSAEQRSWVGLVVQEGLAEFGRWLRDPAQPPVAEPAIFAAAPRELARSVTLRQTVQLIRVTVEVLEEAVPELAAPGDEALLEQWVLRYSREVAFAAAEVYAARAEERGAWDARWEASVVEALVRGGAPDAAVLARAGSLGWGQPEWVVAVAGSVPSDAGALTELRAGLRGQGLLVGVSGGRLIVVVGAAGDPAAMLGVVAEAMGPGPVVHGPAVPDLPSAVASVREALAGLAAAPAWPQAPRPVPSGALLAERVAAGEEAARRQLLSQVHSPLLAAGGDLLLTASAWAEAGGSVEGTARALFLHPNTVRYRLRKVLATVGRDLTVPREAQEVRLAILLGRLEGPPGSL